MLGWHFEWPTLRKLVSGQGKVVREPQRAPSLTVPWRAACFVAEGSWASPHSQWFIAVLYTSSNGSKADIPWWNIPGCPTPRTIQRPPASGSCVLQSYYERCMAVNWRKCTKDCLEPDHPSPPGFRVPTSAVGIWRTIPNPASPTSPTTHGTIANRRVLHVCPQGVPLRIQCHAGILVQMVVRTHWHTMCTHTDPGGIQHSWKVQVCFRPRCCWSWLCKKLVNPLC